MLVYCSAISMVVFVMFYEKPMFFVDNVRIVSSEFLERAKITSLLSPPRIF